MSIYNIQPFFAFKRVKIAEVDISKDAKVTQVKLEPDNRYLPICSGCKKTIRNVHSYEYRAIRDLPMSQFFTPEKTLRT